MIKLIDFGFAAFCKDGEKAQNFLWNSIIYGTGIGQES